MVPAHGNRLLAALPPQEWNVLAPHLRPVRLEQGHVLFEAEGVVDHAYFPVTSVIALLAPMRDGSFVESATIGREGIVGFVSVMCSRRSYGQAVAQIPGTAYRIGHAFLQRAVEERSGLRQHLLCFAEALVCQVMQSVACNAVHDVASRLGRWLLVMQDRMDGAELPLTHEFLAEILAVQRPTVTVALGELQRQGLVSSRRGRILILDRQGLEQIACECYPAVRAHFERLLPRTYC
jgi:CRP-like cAMP-binding protein